MVETCRAMLDLGDLVRSARQHGVVGLIAGTNDLAAEMRCRPGPDRTPLLPFLTTLVAAARSADLGVLDGVCNMLDDPGQVERECRQGLEYGFDGKTLIHPSQIGIANRVFTPSDAEVAWSRQIVDAFAASDNASRGAIRVGGRMVEHLHLAEAQRVLTVVAMCRAGAAKSG